MVTLRTPKPLPGLKYAISTGQATITGYTGSGDAVILPDDINGVPVTSGANAFHSCSSLTISTNVTSLGSRVFSDCTSLASVTSIGSYAFSGCSNMASITLGKNLASIGNWAFASCGSLASITIPSNVASIGYNAFAYCTHLKNAVFEGNAPSMGSTVFGATASGFTVQIFNGATGFTTPTWNGYPVAQFNTAVNNGQITITGYTGYAGSSNAVIVPESVNGLSVAAIAANVFASCSSLTSITIPASVTSIGDSAFAGCSSLSLVYFMCNAPSIGSASIPDFTATKGQVHNGSQKI